jgi:transcription antitermination factor NusG
MLEEGPKKMVESSQAGQCRDFPLERSASPSAEAASRHWYAVFTVPQNEKTVARRLAQHEIEAFLPTYETVRVWKNRQRVHLVLPLFPCYLFVRITHRERGKVLASPGVVRIVGSQREPVPVPDETIEFLRSDINAGKFEPYRELVVGERVRIKAGSFQGLEGTLIRKSNQLRFVLSVAMINQHAAIEVRPDQLEAAIN